MKINLIWEGKKLEADLSKPLSIALPIRDGDKNPNCYFANPVRFEVIRGDGFVGSTKLGGPVNHQKLTLSPHGNGTHTECYGHITDLGAVIVEKLKSFHHFAQLISLKPVELEGDLVIDRTTVKKAKLQKGINSLVIRTLPNSDEKQTKVYSGQNPPYFTEDAMDYIVDCNIEHLVTDLPSVDREQDGGNLLAHKSFWNIKDSVRENATITELAFIPDHIKDGLYLLNLQILSLHMDASPSNPNLYSLNTI